MKIVNLTPHKLNVFADTTGGPELVNTFEPSGTVARVAIKKVLIGDAAGVPLYETIFGDVENLPESQQDTIFVVSLLVRQAAPERTDLYSPGELLRNEDGQPIGCIGLSR